MIRPFLTVSSGTLLSRLLGFVRDSLVAALLGAGPVADAFLVAFQFINVVRRLLTEGALNAALVPAWLRLREAEGAIAAAAFAGRVVATLGAATFLLAAVIGLAMPSLVALLPARAAIADGQALRSAIGNAQLMLPYLAFAGPAAVMMALANAQGRFAVTAFSPLLFNIALIATAFLMIVRGDAGDAEFVARVLAITVGIAGLLQLAVLVFLRSNQAATPLRASLDPQMREFLGRALPGMIASSAPQLALLVAAMVASFFPSAISWLYYANRLIELPVGLVGVAMGTVLVGKLSHAMQAGDDDAAAHAQSRAIELAAALALPAMLGLIVLAEPVVRLLFQHGAFTEADTASTARVLSWLALGLPAQILFKTVAPGFFARGNTSTPLLAVLKGILLTLASAYLFGHLFGAQGIAAGIALGAWGSALGLVREAVTRYGFAIDQAARRRLPRIAAAAMIMGAVLWLAPTAGGAGLAEAASLLALIAAGIALYGSFLVLFGVTGWRETVNAFRAAPRDLRG